MFGLRSLEASYPTSFRVQFVDLLGACPPPAPCVSIGVIRQGKDPWELTVRSLGQKDVLDTLKDKVFCDLESVFGTKMSFGLDWHGE